jgi:hypothetical protein
MEDAMKFHSEIRTGFALLFSFTIGAWAFHAPSAEAQSTKQTISFREVRMKETTSPRGTLADAGSYVGAEGQIVGFSCVPAGADAVCYLALRQ